MKPHTLSNFFNNKAKKYEMAKIGQKRTLAIMRLICDYFYKTSYTLKLFQNKAKKNMKWQK